MVAVGVGVGFGPRGPSRYDADMQMNATEVASALEQRIKEEFPQLEVEVKTYDFARYIRWEVTDPESSRSLPSGQEHRPWRVYLEPSAVEATLETIRTWLESGP